MKEKKGLGIVGLIIAAGLLAAAWHFLPSLRTMVVVVGMTVLIGIAVLVAVVLYFAFRRPPEEKDTSEEDSAAALLARGRTDLVQLRQLTMRVRDKELRRAGEGVCGTIDEILKALKGQPEDIQRVRNLFTYYLPTVGGILRRYIRLEQSGIPTEKEKVLSCLKDIRTAMERLYGSLFDDDKLDLTVEMEVLRQICMRDGLLDGSTGKTEKDDITLTL